VEAFNLVDLQVNSTLWTVLPDGRLLVIRKGEDEDEVQRFDVVVNWIQELSVTMAKARANAR
jgi:hypothetical protein